jgi:NAD(P)-dependent dehydrogenase (short-subunit alcohol dehydrogenase family)
MTGSQTGKVAIVTGGSANLGKLFAESAPPRTASTAGGVRSDAERPPGGRALQRKVHPVMPTTIVLAGV